MTQHLGAPARTRILLLAAACLAGTALSGVVAKASAQAAPASADVVSIVLTPRVVGNRLQSLHLETRIIGDADGETKLLIAESDPEAAGPPSWSAIAVENATISGKGGERVLRHAPSAPITIRYDIVPAPDGAFKNLLKPTYFSVLGAETFFQIDEREPEYRFQWGPIPIGWTVVSDLDHKVGDPSTPYPISTLYGGSDIIVKDHKVGAGRLRLAMRDDSALKPEFLGALIGRIGDAANALWHDSGSEYLVTLTTLPDYKGQAGTGLGDAFALYLGPDPDLPELRNTLAHEYLHTWIGRRFGGGPRWFREGFTQYFSPILNLRAGSYSPADFAAQWNAMLKSYAGSPMKLAPSAQVEAAWAGNRDAKQLSENRSAMVAALLDYRLTRASKGKVRLSDIMLQVKKDWDAKRGKGDGPTRLVAKARAMTGVDLQPTIDRYLVRGEEVTLPADVFGKCLAVRTASIPKYDRGFTVKGIGDPVTDVDPAGRAYAAGIRKGMIIVAREAGKPGDSSVENVFRVKDDAGERVIRYLPAGQEMMSIQQVQVTGLGAKAATRCAREISGLRH
ncbi:hypothetical protein G7078_02850 [Sphingomonas sinipercae]|uniref:Peptidase M61 catalytic domain-containing protein n=1 Tax=Sphingomonas sinipercae TaxID=2714944 RepID=A0A6G7ZLN0_9SPHN|nr:hypothetical protein [Sphingomonas sinipercae]QIL01828.1 hypothetical protein G7078_02850 [Sphingomonas sinipercae]